MALNPKNWRQTFDEWFARLEQPVPTGPKWHPTAKAQLDPFTGEAVCSDLALDKGHGTLGS